MDDVSFVSKLFAVCDRNADGYIARDELVAFFSKHAAPGALLRQLKVESIEAAVEAGKHVLAQKPVTLSADDLARLPAVLARAADAGEAGGLHAGFRRFGDFW